MFAEYTDIGQIAAECGFAELSYFSRIFRQRLGMSAIQFRQLPIMEQMDAIHRIDTP
jgi:AraC-like DNA-binding protein